MIVRFPKKGRGFLFLNHFGLVLILTAIAVAVCYFWVDLPLAKLAESLPKEWRTPVKLVTILIDPKTQLFAWPLLFFFFRFLWKRELFANRALLVLVSIALSNVVTELLKRGFCRARPELFFSQDLYGFFPFHFSSVYTSFPSGHACTIGALCGAFACLYPHRWFSLFLLSSILASTRILLNAHFIGDVIGGVIVGFLVAGWCYKVMKQEQFPLIRRT